MDERTRRVPEVEVRDSASRAEEELESEPLESQSLFAFLSSVGRAGSWAPADRIDALALMGEVKLDFCEAELPPSGIVEIRTMAVMGSIKLHVPRDADVELEGMPLLGGFKEKLSKRRRRAHEVVRDWVAGDPEPLDDDLEEPPLFRVTGFALLGDVEVIRR